MIFFTTGSFVAVSGLVIGFRKETARFKDIPRLMRRGFRLIAFPLSAAAVVCIVESSWNPLEELMRYPLGGNGLSTFSILFVLSFVSLTVPFIPRTALSRVITAFILIFIGFIEFYKGRFVPIFWHLYLIAAIFAQFSILIKRLFSAYTSFFGIILVGIVFFAIEGAMASSEYFYWYSRARLVIHTSLLLVVGVFIAQLSFSPSNALIPLRVFLEVFGRNSLFVYIFHYCVLVIFTFFFGMHSLSAIETGGIFATVSIFSLAVCIWVIPVMKKRPCFDVTYRIMFGKYNHLLSNKTEFKIE